MLEKLVGKGFHDKLVEANAVNTVQNWNEEIEKLWKENHNKIESADSDWLKDIQDKFIKERELNVNRSEIRLLLNNIKGKKQILPIGLQTDKVEEKLTAASSLLTKEQTKNLIEDGIKMKEKGGIDKLIKKYTNIDSIELLNKVTLPKYNNLSPLIDKNNIESKGVIIDKYLFTLEELMIVNNGHNIPKMKDEYYMYDKPDFFLVGTFDPLKLNCINLPSIIPSQFWNNSKKQSTIKIESSNNIDNDNDNIKLNSIPVDENDSMKNIAEKKYNINPSNNNDINSVMKNNKISNNSVKRKIKGRPLKRTNKVIDDLLKHKLTTIDVKTTSSWNSLDQFHYNEYPNVIKEKKIENLAQETAESLMNAVKPENTISHLLKKSDKDDDEERKEMEKLNKDIMRIHNNGGTEEEKKNIIMRQEKIKEKHKEKVINKELINRQKSLELILQRTYNVPILNNNDLLLLNPKHYRMYCMLRSHQIFSEALKSNKPNQYILNSYLNVFTSSHLIHESEVALSCFDLYGIKPDSMTYHHLTELYSNSGYIERCLVLRKAMINDHLVPLKRTNGLLVSKLTEEGEIGQALKLLNEIKAKDMKNYPKEYYLKPLRRICEV